MKILGFLILFSTLLFSQTPPHPKYAGLERRFKEAVSSVEKEEYQKAREICDGIIREEPKARGSLLIAGLASLELFESAKAIEYLDAFRKLEPKDPQGVLLSIQAYQNEKRTPKVDALLKELAELRKTDSKLKASPDFIRERFKSEPNRIVVVRQYFDAFNPPFKVWEVGESDLKSKEKTRSLEFSYNVGASSASKNTEAYFFSETVLKEGLPQQINIYREEKSLPDYSTFKKWAIDCLKEPPKPIYSAPYQVKNTTP